MLLDAGFRAPLFAPWRLGTRHPTGSGPQLPQGALVFVEGRGRPLLWTKSSSPALHGRQRLRARYWAGDVGGERRGCPEVDRSWEPAGPGDGAGLVAIRCGGRLVAF